MAVWEPGFNNLQMQIRGIKFRGIKFREWQLKLQDIKPSKNMTYSMVCAIPFDEITRTYM